MNMAKASEADLRMAMDLSTALESLGRHRTMPAENPDNLSEEAVSFDRDDAEDCKKALNKVLDIASGGSLFRVIFGMVVLLDPRNKVLDPNSDILAVHPDLVKKPISTGPAQDTAEIAVRGTMVQRPTGLETPR